MADLDPLVHIARIDATLDALKHQFDYSERSAAQLVRLIEEKFGNRFDTLERRLEEMEKARDSARAERLNRDDEFDKRLSHLERFNARLVGIAIGVSVLTGGSFAAVFKAIGGG